MQIHDRRVRNRSVSRGSALHNGANNGQTSRLVLNLREYGAVSIQGSTTYTSSGPEETGVELAFRTLPAHRRTEQGYDDE